ncbi:MAG: Tol-Pal system subunit TolQ [Oligoflexia bacterium]|nr:MAG: Tol-Pal system subunit TolQ [Oligoflexia bacterium]
MNYAYAAPIQTSAVSVNTSALDAIFQASPVVQMTLLLLIGLSVICWATGYSKYKQFKELAEANEAFLNRFWKATSLDALYEDIEHFKRSSIARVFKSGYMEMQKLAGSTKQDENSPVQLSGIDNLERSIRKTIDLEIAAMESRLTLLATTGSTGPFIGLFGTVWGIMGSFHKIGAMGSASLAVVAPGISEALIATAIGLAAAIPAVVLYNHFISKIRREEMALNNFGHDFLNIAKRNFFKEK